MKTPEEVMPPATAALFHQLRTEALLAPFVLIGGTALSLHLGHRLSEDLDFIATSAKLPRVALEGVIRDTSDHGWSWQQDDESAAIDEFEIAGMDLRDYSQSFIVSNDHGIVRITFFTADAPQIKVLSDSSAPSSCFRIATLPQLFLLKAIACANRSKSRDWLDIYLLLKNYGFTLDAWHEGYQRLGMSDSQFEAALQRVIVGRVSSDDPGFQSLLPDPPSVQEIAAFMKARRREYEVRLANRLR